MILTVTCNPAIDKTVEVEIIKIGGLNRLENIVMDAGGKGINVSKTIHALQGDSICTGFLAGTSGQYIKQALDALSIANDFIWVDGMTRTNLKILDINHDVTELNEAGPFIHQTAIQALTDKILSYCNYETIVVLSGSVPRGVSTKLYADLITKVKETKARMILDADGELFNCGCQARPTVMKPNKHEFVKHFGISLDSSMSEIIAHAKTLLQDETEMVVVSMGEEGAVFLTKDGVWIANAINVEAHSSVGAGDAMVAAIAYAMDLKMSIEDLMKLAVATSAGALTTHGTKPAKRALIDHLLQEVRIGKWIE